MSEQSKSDETKFRSLWSILHDDQRGAVSVETVLIIAAVALPILIFLIRFVWPQIQEYVEKMLDILFGAADDAQGS